MSFKLPIVVAAGTEREATALARQIATIGFSNVATIGDLRQLIPTLSASVCHLVVLTQSGPDNAILDAVRSIRQQFSAATLPVMALTLASDVEVRIAILHAGANDCLTHQADATELATRCTNLVQISTLHRAAMDDAQELQRQFDSRAARLTMLIENGLLMGFAHDKNAMLRHTLFEGQRLLQHRCTC